MVTMHACPLLSGLSCRSGSYEAEGSVVYVYERSVDAPQRTPTRAADAQGAAALLALTRTARGASEWVFRADGSRT